MILPRLLLLWRPLFGAILCLPLLFSSSSALAADAKVEIVEIGLGGVAKVGHWIPIRVAVTSGVAGGRLQVSVPDSDGVETVYGASSPLDTAQSEVAVPVKLGRMSATIRAQLVAEDGRVLATTQRSADDGAAILSATQQLILQCGPSIGVDETLRKGRREYESGRLIELTDLSRLPESSLGLTSVNHIVIVAGDAAPILALNKAQGEALVHWVELGGRMTISAGRDAEALFSDEKFAALSPGKFQGVVRQSRTSGLENFARASKRLAPFDLSLFTDTKGRVEVVDSGPAGEDRPVVIRYPVGFGMVTFIAADIEQEPFKSWPDRRELVASLTRMRSENGDSSGQSANAGKVTHIGYEDLSGQLRSSLDRFKSANGVILVTFSPVAAAIVFYILLIGPGDYFLLRRLIGRMELTWLTFSLIVVVFCISTIVLFRRLKGDQVRVNQIDLVDFDTTSSVIRGTTWANIYSPRTEAFNLDLRTSFDLPTDGDPQVVLSWQGLPGEGLGGLRTTATAAFFTEPYRISVGAEPPAHAIQAMPIQVASTKCLTGNWWSRASAANDEVSPPSTLRKRREFLRGELTNPFPVELTDCVLMYQNWAYVLDGRLAPGGAVSIAEFSEPRDLEWRLTRRRVVQKDFSYVATPWEPSSADVPRIMEMLLFHEAAGGVSYTVLTHRYLQHLDLSEQLRHDRAILLGRAEASACELVRDGKPMENDGERWTFCRAVFAVAPEAETKSD